MMKKIIILFAFILFACLFNFVTPTTAFAGACSSYGGLNCNVVFNGDGTLLCNYGQRVMPIDYNDIKDCFVGCSDSDLDSLMQQYNVPGYYKGIVSTAADYVKYSNEAKQYDDQAKAISGGSYVYRGMGENGANFTMYMSQAAAAYEAANNTIKVLPLYISQLQNQTRQVATACKNLTPNIVCPANSSCTASQFFCNDGYVASGNSCITYNQSCQIKYGANSYGDKINCYCNAGYQWNSQQTGCVIIPAPVSAPVPAVNNPVPDVLEKTNTPSPAPVQVQTQKIQQVNLAQTNTIQNKAEESKKTEVAPAKSDAGFFTKIFSSIKSFFNNIFK